MSNVKYRRKNNESHGFSSDNSPGLNEVNEDCRSQGAKPPKPSSAATTEVEIFMLVLVMSFEIVFEAIIVKMRIN